MLENCSSTIMEKSRPEDSAKKSVKLLIIVASWQVRRSEQYNLKNVNLFTKIIAGFVKKTFKIIPVRGYC